MSSEGIGKQFAGEVLKSSRNSKSLVKFLSNQQKVRTMQTLQYHTSSNMNVELNYANDLNCDLFVHQIYNNPSDRKSVV